MYMIDMIEKREVDNKNLMTPSALIKIHSSSRFTTSCLKVDQLSSSLLSQQFALIDDKHY